MAGPFTADIETIRQRAREHIEQGPITDAYGADRERVVEVLNQVLATEIVCTLRYKRHYFTAQGLQAKPVAAEFLEHAKQEEEHADLAAERIVQLGGEPDFNPQGLVTRAHSTYDDSHSLMDMVKEDLVAERIAIASYQEIVRWLANDDPTTRRVMEEILATEEEHADDLLNILSQISGESSTDGQRDG